LEAMLMQLAESIKSSRKTVFFGGAGISTASGIPDFRSSKGLYQTEFEGLNPEVILSKTFFFDETDKFYRFLKAHMYYPEAMPNGCHQVLAQMENDGLLHSVITQNIDGLHQKAGSKRVIELHGNMNRYYCVRCNLNYNEEVLSQENTPKCTCGGILKPQVTLYEEMLDDSIVEGAIEAISTAEVLIIGGTSLSVYPAASFIRFFSGKKLVIMNQTPTQADERADFIFREPIDQVMLGLKKYL
jgi:NAD-dependent deacetylase